MAILIASPPDPRYQSPARRSIDEVLQRESAPSPAGSSVFKRERLCPREAALHSIVGLRPEGSGSEALDIGLLVHYALEAFFRMIQVHQQKLDAQGAPRDPHYFWGNLADAERAALHFLSPFATEEGYERTFGLVEKMICNYFEMYRGRDRWKVLAVEETLIFDGHITYSARLDLVVEDFGNHNGLLIVEHKCLAAQEQLPMQGGGFETVKVLAEKGGRHRIMTWSEKERAYIPAEVTVQESGRVDPIHKITLRSGRELRCSPEHPVLTARGWVEAQHLQESDWVASVLGTGRMDLVRRIPGHELEILAFMIGDGTMRCHELEILAFMIGDGTMRSAAFTQAEGAALDRVLAFCKRYGVDQCRAAEKFIPEAVWSEPLDRLMCFLGALWSTDGCVDVFDETRRGKIQKKVRLAYATRSEQLAHDVQRLLTMCGYASTKTESTVLYKGERRPHWTIKIVTRGAKRQFLTDILEGAMPFYKYDQQYLEAAREAIKPSDDRPIPSALFSREELRGGHAPNSFAHFAAAKRFGEWDPRLNDSLHWSRVASTFILPPEPTYSVIESTTGVVVTASGIVTHNTARAITEDLLQSYQLDLQILGQVWLLHKCVDMKQLPPFRGVLIDIISKHERATRFERLHVHPSDKHLINFQHCVEDWTEVRKTWQRLGWPQALGNCAGAMRFFSRCRFYDICHSRPDVPVSALKREYDAVGAPIGYRLASNGAWEDAADPSRYVI